ncbi:MAG: DUF4861 family protein [Bacteroidota bacterium]
MRLKYSRSGTYYALMDLSDQSITYHMYAGWEKSAEKFAEEDQFVRYVQYQAQKFTTPVEVVKLCLMFNERSVYNFLL